MFVVLGFDDDEEVERYMLYEYSPDGYDIHLALEVPACEVGLKVLFTDQPARFGGQVYGEWTPGLVKPDLVTLMNQLGLVKT
jgi:hypothetical protein